jgi:hypothetical protein
MTAPALARAAEAYLGQDLTKHPVEQDHSPLMTSSLLERRRRHLR